MVHCGRVYVKARVLARTLGPVAELAHISRPATMCSGVLTPHEPRHLHLKLGSPSYGVCRSQGSFLGHPSSVRNASSFQ